MTEKTNYGLKLAQTIAGGALIFGIGCVIYLLYDLSNINAEEKKITEQVKTNARAMTGIEYSVVSGWNEESGNYYSIALLNPADGSRLYFTPCTKEQRMLKIGDKVTFKFNPKISGEHYLTEWNKSCFLEKVE